MTEKKHRSPDRKETCTSEHSSEYEYVQISPPFEGMSEAEKIEQVKKLGEHFNHLYETSYQGLQENIPRYDPILLLSSFAFYGLTTIEGVDREFTEKNPILQHHVELLQSLVLRHERADFEFKPILLEDYQKFSDFIQQATKAFFVRRLTTFEPSMTIEQRQRIRAIESIRTYTQSVRNWGYPQQVTSIVASLFASLDDDIEQELGIKISHLIKMFIKLVTVAEDRTNAHLRLVRPMVRAKSISSVVEKYYKSFPELKNSKEKLLTLFKKQNASLELVKQQLISHSDLRLPAIFTFSLADFVDAYPTDIDTEKLKSILDKWTLLFGDLAEDNPEYFFMGNPIWKKPLICLQDDRYFWPVVGTFYSFCLELMEGVISDNVSLYKRYEDRRGEFLEEHVRKLFESSFPSAKLYRGSQWHDPVTGRDFENDLLVQIDSYLIVVEAKSGKVTEQAKRGGELRLESTIKKLMVDPSLQAKRFADYLKDNPRVHEFSTKRGAINRIDTSHVSEVIRLNVILDLLGHLDSHWPNLRQAGFISKDMDLGPTISLANLEVVFEILEGMSEKLHYLIRRMQFELNASYAGDELDLLSFYIDTGFNIGGTEFDHTHLLLTGMSKSFDPYFMGKWHGKAPQKPRLRLTTWWRDILGKIEERKIPLWTEFGYILLNVAYEDQVSFEKGFKRVKKIVQKEWEKPKHECFVQLLFGPPQRRDAIVGFAYKRIASDERNERMKQGAIEAAIEAPTDRVLVIAVDVERDDYPYSVIACVGEIEPVSS